jgi:hypothetical protein
LQVSCDGDINRSWRRHILLRYDTRCDGWVPDIQTAARIENENSFWSVARSGIDVRKPSLSPKISLDIENEARELTTGGIRSSSIVTLARFPFIKTINEPDVLYAITDLSILACAEVGTCIIATSAGTLRPLFLRHPGASRELDLPSSRIQITTAQAGEATGSTSVDVENVVGATGPNEKVEDNFGKIAIASHTIM